MQSILQYRKFKSELKNQIQRHGTQGAAGCLEKPAGSGRRTSNDGSDIQTETRDHASEEKNLENEIPWTHSGERHHEHDGETGLSLSEAQSHPQITAYQGSHDVHGHSSRVDGAPGSVSATSTLGPALPGDFEKEKAYDAPDGDTSSDSSSDHAGEPGSQGQTATRTATTLGRMMTGVSMRSKEYDGQPGKVFVVGYRGADDPLNPHNWSFSKRIFITFTVASIGLIVGLASSIDSAALDQAREEFGVSEVTESLATGLYLVGFGFGAFFAGPISETVGRNPVYLVTGALFMIFVMASALAPNIGAQLTFRFLAGFFGSTPLTCAGGSISDMYSASERTLMFPAFANAAFWGPILGPIIGGWIAQSHVLSWRWCEWITLICSGLVFGTVFFFMPETYAPVLLSWKAKHMRDLTGDDRYVSPQEVQDTKFWDRLVHNVSRPFILLSYEPIVMLITLYLTVVYIVLFTFLTGFEFIFTETYGLSQGLTFTIFVALGVGFFFTTLLVPWVNGRYKRKLSEAEDRGESSLPPEHRLIFAMVSAPALPIGIFWLAWTSYPSISVWSGIASMVPIGFAILGIFLTSYQYLIDAFERYAASALVGVTFVRYIAAGGMIPVSIPFYKNLGVHWTLTILGVISLIMTPVPYLFYIYGERIRKMSKHAVGKAT